MKRSWTLNARGTYQRSLVGISAARNALTTAQLRGRLRRMTDGLFLDPGKGIRASSGRWYRIEQLLGAGGNAVTYLVVCTDGPHRGVPFALKFFRRMSKPERLAAFLEELDFLKTCDHPAIMRVYDDGKFSFWMDGKQASSHFSWPSTSQAPCFRL